MNPQTMRDVGLMGESIFSLWCGEAGLIPNGSAIDKTGWDFFVEFPYEKSDGISADMQPPPVECKIQVKATDKKNGKLAIKLSNLRRLATAPLPTFFLFIEFDYCGTAENAYLVHVDNSLIDKVLKKIRNLEQKFGVTNFNKKTITVNYDEEHKLGSLDGKGLKDSILKSIPSGLDDYVARKASHLKTTGFGNGSATISFQTNGIENLKDLIDVSIGVKEQVNVENFVGHSHRFGIYDSEPFLNCPTGKISMPDISPNHRGKIRFRDDEISPFLSFDVNIYISPLNAVLDDSLKTIRVEGEFFNLVFTPYTGNASYSFSFDAGVALKIDHFLDALKLSSKLSTPGKYMHAQLEFSSQPILDFHVGSGDFDVDFEQEITTLENAKDIAQFFNIIDDAKISLYELEHQKNNINSYSKIVDFDLGEVIVEFTVDDIDFDPRKKICAVYFLPLILGNYIVGIIVSFIGEIDSISDIRYRLQPKEMLMEYKLVNNRNESFSQIDLERMFNEVSKKHSESGLSVVTMHN